MNIMRVLILLLTVALLVPACDDTSTNEPGQGDLVTVAGIVRNIDTLQPAPGVRVRLLDSSYSDEVATGTDGAYELKVPRNSKLILVTDDFDTNVDEWYPIINADFPPVAADRDMLDWPIHSCPQTIGKPDGSLSALDNYLKNQDDANGDIFPANSLAECSGVLFLSIWICENGTIPADGYAIRVKTDTDAFPVAYPNTCVLTHGWCITCDPVMHSPDYTACDDSLGQALSFGAPSFSGNMVAVTLEDTLSSRNLQWTLNTQLPVRKGTITITFPCVIDGVADKSFKEFADACNLFGPN